MALTSRLLFYLIFVSLFGCSTQKKDIFEDNKQDSDQVVQTIFDSSDERVGDFRVGEIRVSEEPEKKEKKKKNKEVKSQEKTTPNVEKKPEPSAESQPKQQTSKEDNGTSEVPKVIEEDPEVEKVGDEIYPEEFVDYDERSKKLWESVRPIYYPGEKFVYDIKYLGITAAHIKITAGKITEVAKRKALHYKAVLKSARFYSAFYEMEDTLESYVDAKDQVPLRYSLVQRETKKNVDDLQIFDRKEDKTYFFYKRVKDGEVKEEEKEAYIPKYFHDTFSAMFFVRGLPMNIGDIYEFPIITRAKLWLVKIKVDSIEEVKSQGEWVDAYKIEAETRFPDELSKERGSITFWVSTSERRKLLRFSADVRFGSIYGELVDYSPGGQRLDPEDL